MPDQMQREQLLEGHFTKAVQALLAAGVPEDSVYDVMYEFLDFCEANAVGI